MNLLSNIKNQIYQLPKFKCLKNIMKKNKKSLCKKEFF